MEKEIQKDRLRVALSLGIIATYVGAFYLIKPLAEPLESARTSPLATFFVFFFFIFLTMSISLLVGFLLLTGVHYGYEKRDLLEAYHVYALKKYRTAMYDYGMAVATYGLVFSLAFSVYRPLIYILMERFKTGNPWFDSLFEVIFTSVVFCGFGLLFRHFLGWVTGSRRRRKAHRHA